MRERSLEVSDRGITRPVPIELRADSRGTIEGRVAEDGNIAAATGVVVLGMGRSGTSSVTQMFARVGFFVGHEEEIMGAAESNPTGHWEHLSIWRRNEELLAKLGGSWFDPPPMAAQLAARRWAIPLLGAEVERILDQAQDAPIAVKDPRIGVLMELWDQSLRNCLHPVLVIRDPVEIALSLSRRDGTPLPFGLAAWELHMTGLLRHLHGRTVTVAPYRKLVTDPECPQAIVDAAIANIDSRRTTRLRPEEARGTFDETFYRNRAAADQHYEYLTSHQLDLWRALSSLRPGSQSLQTPVELHAPSDATMATVRHETERLATISERANLMAELTTERTRSETMAGSLAAERELNIALLAALRVQCDRADRAVESHGHAENWLASIQGSVSWKLTQPLRALKRVLRARASA